MSDENEYKTSRTRLIIDLAINKTLDKYLKQKEEQEVHYMKITLKLLSEPIPVVIENVLRVSADKRYFTMEYSIDNQPKTWRESIDKVEYYNVEQG